MKTRQDALDKVKTLQNELNAFLNELTTGQPTDLDDPLNKNLDRAIIALQSKIYPISNELTELSKALGREAAAAPTAPLLEPLMTRLTTASDACKNLYNGIEAQTFRQSRTAITINVAENCIATINTFEIDHPNQTTIAALKLRLKEILNLPGPRPLTYAEIDSLTIEIDSFADQLAEYKDEDNQLKEQYKSYAADLDGLIHTLVVPPETKAHLDALTDLMGKATLANELDLFDNLEKSYNKLLAQKTAVETSHRELTNGKNLLLQPANVSKKIAWDKLRKGEHAAGLAAVSKLNAGIAQTKLDVDTAKQALQQAEIDASKPQVDVAVGRIDKFIVELKALAKNPAITSPIFKTEIDNFAKRLKAKKVDIQLPANIINSKGQTATQIISTSVINDGLKLKDIATAKIQITPFILATETEFNAIDKDAAVTDFKVAIHAVLRGLKHHSLNLDDMKITAADVAIIKAELNQFEKGIEHYEDSLAAYRTAAAAIKEIDTTLIELAKAFGEKTTAPADVQKLFADLEKERQTIDETQLKAITTEQKALLNDPKNANEGALTDVIKTINSPANQNALKELNEKALVEIMVQEEQVELAKVAQAEKDAKEALSAPIKAIADKLETTIKEAKAIIDSIEGYDTKTEKEKDDHNLTLDTLNTFLTGLKTNLKNDPTAALKNDAEEALATANELKTDAEATQKAEKESNKTAVARATILNLKAEAKSKIQLFKDKLGDLRAIKIEAYDAEARKHIKELDTFLNGYEKELAKIEATIAKANEAADIPATTLPNANVEQTVLDAIASKESALKELDKLAQNFTDAKKDDDIANWKNDIENRKDALKNIADETTATPYLPKSKEPVPDYEFTVNNPRKAFDILDESMKAHIITIAHWERTIFSATASAKHRRALDAPQTKKDFEDKVRDMHRALLFYQNYSSLHPKLGSALAKKYVADQIIKLEQIETYFPDLQGDQKYVLTGSGIVDIQYYNTLKDAEADPKTFVAAGAISVAIGRTTIGPGDAVRRDHQMLAIKADGSSAIFSDKIITHTNPTTKSLQSNFYRDAAHDVKDIPDVQIRKSLFKVITRPADELILEANTRLDTILNDHRYKGGAILIHSGLQAKETEALRAVMIAKGIKLDANCLPWLPSNSVAGDDDVQKSVREVLLKNKALLPKGVEKVEADSDDARSRFRKS